MSYLINNEQKMNDIIFANRNKSYGAYEIRSSYGSTVFRALSYMSLGFGSLFAISFYLTRPEPEPDTKSSLIIHDSVYVVPFEIKQEEIERQEKTEEAKSTESDNKSETNKPLVIDSLPDSKVTSTVTLNNETPVTNSGSMSVPGGEKATSAGTGTASVKGNEFGTKTVKNQVEVDEMPEFEGGLRALKEYLVRNTHYPQQAVDEGRGGTLHVRFVVNEKGEVVDAELMNKVDDDLNKEALRVVSSIPKFKSPGKVKGDAVSTYYHVPIRFTLK